ncbi:MAG: redoxin domain-containing protein [Candidatus Eisenbacteria bacterium]|nr:redoxin domain-containing protein [Candidatus Latescibacterota bacterium]MBD3301675.1 redoxin domain-containing protein [Candidatus Eisenbacteria bacterium]
MPLGAGERAPRFRLRGIDNAYWILGEPDRRRNVLLVFFRREVGTCRLLLPFVERLHRRAHEHESEILGISLDTHPDTLELAEDYTLTFPILLEEKGYETFQAYGVSEVPTLFRLDADLRVAGSLIGWSKPDFERLGRSFLDAIGGGEETIWEEQDVPPPEQAAAMPVAELLRREG